MPRNTCGGERRRCYKRNASGTFSAPDETISGKSRGTRAGHNNVHRVVVVVVVIVDTEWQERAVAAAASQEEIKH